MSICSITSRNWANQSGLEKSGPFVYQAALSSYIILKKEKEKIRYGFTNMILSPTKTGGYYQFSSFAQSCPTLRPHESQHAGPPCPSPTPGVYSNSCPSSRWCHRAISSSVIPFSSCPQSLPASGSFPMSQLFTCGGQSVGVSASASVLPMNTQHWWLL